MAASLILSVQTGTSPGSANETNITGIDMISADNATNSLANRQAYPITVGTNSYEKWVRLKIATAPANGVGNFKVWGDGAIDISTTLAFTSNYVTYQTPSANTSTIANRTFTQYTASSPATWHSVTISATNAYTNYAVFQLQVAATAGPGNWTQETVNYSYDEL